MTQEFAEARRLLFDGALKTLQKSSKLITSIRHTGRGDSPINGLSLDLFPWNGMINLSLRLFSDCSTEETRYNSAGWKYFAFSRENEPKELQDAAHHIQEFYEAAEDNAAEEGGQLQERAHLVFLAGAEALLDPRIAEQLQSLGIDAPVHGDQFPSRHFEYIVVDEDATVKGNYCEMVTANRVTQRLLGQGTSRKKRSGG